MAGLPGGSGPTGRGRGRRAVQWWDGTDVGVRNMASSKSHKMTEIYHSTLFMGSPAKPVVPDKNRASSAPPYLLTDCHPFSQGYPEAGLTLDATLGLETALDAFHQNQNSTDAKVTASTRYQ